MERLQGSDWHNIKKDLIMVRVTKNTNGNIRGIYEDKNGHKFVHWLNDEEKKDLINDLGKDINMIKGYKILELIATGQIQDGTIIHNITLDEYYIVSAYSVHKCKRLENARCENEVGSSMFANNQIEFEILLEESFEKPVLKLEDKVKEFLSMMSYAEHTSPGGTWHVDENSNEVDVKNEYDYALDMINDLQQKNFVLETSIKGYENLTNLLSEQSKTVLLFDDKLEQIFQLCLDEKNKSNVEIGRIRSGLLNPTTTTNFAIGCELDIQKVLNKILNIIERSQ